MRRDIFFPVEFLSGSAMKPCAMMSAQLLPNNNRCSKGINHIKRNTHRKNVQNIEGGLLLPTLLLLKCFQGETTLATGVFEGLKKPRKPNKKSGWWPHTRRVFLVQSRFVHKLQGTQFDQLKPCTVGNKENFGLQGVSCRFV